MSAGKKKSETVWVKCVVIKTTDLAVLIDDGKKNVWVPRRMIVDMEDDIVNGKSNSFEFTENFAADKDLV